MLLQDCQQIGDNLIIDALVNYIPYKFIMGKNEKGMNGYYALPNLTLEDDFNKKMIHWDVMKDCYEHAFNTDFPL
jgi:hypothetical protein